ncbi:hypothetical protein [Rhodoplanes sp. SY1]|uniref:hypothetical protein n=1 Tax=Rhodoplanes sp. SY1 TaxID=3166646 RepID=UPI0038B6925F
MYRTVIMRIVRSRSMGGRRHSLDEVLAKLARADALEAQGATRRDVARSLGVSIMTYHRWLKMRDERGPSTEIEPPGKLAVSPPSDGSERSEEASRTRNHRDVEDENERLRRLVVDMLLEKVRLEDELQGLRESRFRRVR